MLDAQARAPLPSARLYDASPVPGARAHKKPVGAFALPLFWIIRNAHENTIGEKSSAVNFLMRLELLYCAHFFHMLYTRRKDSILFWAFLRPCV